MILYHGSNTGNIKVLKTICNCSYIKILGRLNTMVNVVGYIRVSTVNQVKEGYSLGEQLDEIEKYCAANGFRICIHKRLKQW